MRTNPRKRPVIDFLCFGRHRIEEWKEIKKSKWQAEGGNYGRRIFAGGSTSSSAAMLWGFRQQRENERHRTGLICQDHGASCVYSRTGLRDQEIRTNSLRSILQESLLGPSCLNTSRGTTSPVEAEFAHLNAGESYRERETTSFIHSGVRRGWIKQRPRPAGKEGLR